MSKPTEGHLAVAHRLLRYLKSTPGQGILLSSKSELTLKGFTDSDWARCLQTRRSITGFSIYLGDSLISWRSKKQPTVSKSSAEAEYRAIAYTTCELQWLLYLLADLHIAHHSPAILYTDSKSAYCLAHNPVFHDKTKHIDVDCHFIREKLQNKIIQLINISPEHNVADLFTKPLGPQLFDHFKSKMNVQNIHTSS